MAITLVVNPGSSSKKFALYKEQRLLINAYVERSKDGFEMCTTVSGVQQLCESLNKQGFEDSLRTFIERAQKASHINSIAEITRVAMRVVAPGTFFQRHQIIDEQYITRLQKLKSLAPLHIPHILNEVNAVKKFLPEARIVAASDSAFHSTIPEHVRRYSIPKIDSETYDIYHFGYHGLSVASVMRRVKGLSSRDIKRVIICHIGSGVSVTAVKNGISIDTTMGYAPGSGLLMSSRAGDLPADALLALMQAKNLKIADALVYMQSSGGLQGLSGESDLRLLLERRAKGDADAGSALESFIYQIQKSIGSYMAVMGGLDALIFTATASERSPLLRSLITKELSSLQIYLDEDKNDQCVSRDGLLNKDDSNIDLWVIKTDEAAEILRISDSL